jgi:hypothetical protein
LNTGQPIGRHFFGVGVDLGQLQQGKPPGYRGHHNQNGKDDSQLDTDLEIGKIHA